MQKSSTKNQTNGASPKVTEPLMNEIPGRGGTDVSKPSEKPTATGDNDQPSPQTPPIVVTVLDGKGSSPPPPSSSSSSKPSSDRNPQFPFSSVPNIIFSSAAARDPKVQLVSGPLTSPHHHHHHPPPRQRSSTMDHAERIRLRHVVREVVPEHPKPARAPMGLSFIGLSDANVNRVRATTHLNVSRRDIFVSGSVLHIPDHHSVVQQQQQQQQSSSSHFARSGLSMRSGGRGSSVRSEAEAVLCACVPESARDTLLQMLDFSIMRNKAYVLILVGNIFAMLGFYVPFVFMPQKALSLGIPEGKAAFLLSIIGQCVCGCGVGRGWWGDSAFSSPLCVR